MLSAELCEDSIRRCFTRVSGFTTGHGNELDAPMEDIAVETETDTDRRLLRSDLSIFGP